MRDPEKILIDDLAALLREHTACCVREAHVDPLARALVAKFVQPIGPVEVVWGVPRLDGSMMEYADRRNAETDAEISERVLHRRVRVHTHDHETEWKPLGVPNSDKEKP